MSLEQSTKCALIFQNCYISQHHYEPNRTEFMIRICENTLNPNRKHELYFISKVHDTRYQFILNN